MADKKVSELSAITNLSGDDLLLVVNDPSGTPTSNKVTLANLFANVVPNVVYKGNVTHSGAEVNVYSGQLNITANTIFSGRVVYNGIYEFSGVQILSNNVIFNGDLIANSGAEVRGGKLNLTNAEIRVNGKVVVGEDGSLHANNTIGAGDISDDMLAQDYIETAAANLLINDRIQVANAHALLTPYIEVSNADAKFATKENSLLTGTTSLIGGNVSISQSGQNIELVAESNLHISTPDNTKGLYLNFEEVAAQNRLTANQIILSSNVGIIMTNIQANDFFTSNASIEGIPAGAILYTNNQLIIATDSNTLKRADLYQDIRPNITFTFQPNISANAWVVFGGGISGEENPTLTLYRGFTYHFKERFAEGHNIIIRNEYGGTSFSNGVYSNTITQGLYFEVPQKQVANLYYECTIHPQNMRGVLVIK